ncbi:ras-related protein Rap-2a-like [Arctopsyche grandis]|uniref:ras-related protein Rap-2a-like n=1 Tax=Arctopsyche grandis TaxID=121162 RepID=UPI00406D8B9A
MNRLSSLLNIEKGNLTYKRNQFVSLRFSLILLKIVNVDARTFESPLKGTESQNNTAQTAQGPYRVAMLGASGVGKTALTCQFTTSEYICAYDASLDEEYGQKNVSVLLDGQETELEIIDHPASEMSVESFCATYNADVFVVVYSVEDRLSLKAAEEILLYLWKGEYMLTRGVILVANKADLERKREVPMVVGRRLANNYGCKFIEASSGIAHNVDELLVGILAQVQLNPQRASSRRSKNKRGLGSGVRLPTAPRLLARLLGIRRRAKSCENLFII